MRTGNDDYIMLQDRDMVTAILISQQCYYCSGVQQRRQTVLGAITHNEVATDCHQERCVDQSVAFLFIPIIPCSANLSLITLIFTSL